MMQQVQKTMTANVPFFKTTLPLPPGINDSYKPVTVPRKRTLKKGSMVFENPRAGEPVARLAGTDKLNVFKEEAVYRLRDYHNTLTDKNVVEAIIANCSKRSPIRTPLKITITFYFSTLWRKDIDGGEKAVIDAVFSHLGINDNLIVDKHTQKCVDADEPRCEVEVSCIAGR